MVVVVKRARVSPFEFWEAMLEEEEAGRDGRVGAGVSLLQVCALVAGYACMEPAAYLSLFNVLSLFTVLQVLNTALHCVRYLVVRKMGASLAPAEDGTCACVTV